MQSRFGLYKPTLLRVEKESGPNKSQGKNSLGVTLKQWVGFQQQAQKEPREQPLSFPSGNFSRALLFPSPPCKLLVCISR